MTASVVKACQIIVRSMSLNKLYSEFALVIRNKIPIIFEAKLDFLQAIRDVTKRSTEA